MAITAFPFHLDPSRETHTHGDPLLYLEQGLPCPLLSCSPGSRRLMSTGWVPLFSRRAAPIHSSSGPSVKSYAFTKGQAYSQSAYTPLPLLLALPAAAHKLSKPSSTFSHCARLKGRLAGEVEKSCVCLNMSLKKRGGELVKRRPVWLGCTHPNT